MIYVRCIVTEEAVNAYLAENNLESGYVPIVAALLQPHGTATGRPVVNFVVEIDGKKVVAKLTWRLLEVVCGGMRGALERLAQSDPTGNTSDS